MFLARRTADSTLLGDTLVKTKPLRLSGHPHAFAAAGYGPQPGHRSAFNPAVLDQLHALPVNHIWHFDPTDLSTVASKARLGTCRDAA